MPSPSASSPSSSSSRLLSLLSLLQARPEWPGQLLAERLGVSPRTVRRDIGRLRDLGYPVAATKGPAGGYRLGAGTRLPPLLFDDEQAVALAVALRTAATSGAGVEEAAARALHTVRQVLPARLRHRVDALDVTAVPHPHPQADPNVLLTLSAAVRARELLRFDYAPATPDSPPRRAEPHHLVTWGGRWYLVAWDLEREAWRTFRADRITPRTPTGPRFAPRALPGGDVAAFVCDRFRGPGAWPCRGEATLDLPAQAVAPYAQDGMVEPLGPDRCRLHLSSWSWPALAAAFARFDAPLHAPSPTELRTAFTTLAARLTAAAS
ncbi:transcriptional regulator [Streptomyces sp. DSM 44917]|uniref:Transcriptional regulator n=1 Tax=Streptomyces boetiae TaxID=3075541 RepID=A0ABU2LFV5_9ACTN|nr:transcriptional regulator [Streptomyces sp. DSM 44917]MDT0310469.1 transcriptional regulator [Streptomyces sp. DSM 44917]